MATQTTTHVDELKINRLTKAQYNSIAEPSSTELYIVTDEQVDYADITNKPTIGNATLTIQKNGTTVQTFGANATSNVTANIIVPTTAADVNAVAANTAITGATKCKITYDSKGLVTAGANLAASDIPNLSLSKITDVTATAAELNVLDGITASTAELNILDGVTATTAEINVLDGITASTTELNYVDGVTSNVQTQLNTITGKIPSAATSSNQLADKAFVNSSINAIAAYYITSDAEGDAFATKAALDTGPYYHDGSTRTPTENDYAIVAVDETHDNACTRYSYTGSQWSFQYIVNDTPFTQAQLNAINSGITSTKVGNYDTHIADTTIHVTSADKTNWDNAVHKTGNESIAGTKTFTAAPYVPYINIGPQGTSSTSLEGGEVVFKGAQGEPNHDKNISIDRYNGAIRLFGTDSQGTTKNLLIANIQNGTLKGVTPTEDTTSSTQIDTVGARNTKLQSYQPLLVSGTNIKTVNNNSLLGSGNITIDSLPSQSGQSGKYLTTNGTTASWAASGVIPFGTSTTAAATVQKEVSIPEITELNPGQVIIVQPTITSTVANSTLKLNDFDAYPMRYNNAAITTSTDSVVWGATFPSTWLFDGTYWVFLGHGLDSNSTYTVNYSIDAGQYTAGTGTYAVTRYSILAQKPDGTWEKITATNANYTTATTKSVNTSGFLLNQLRYYATTTNVATSAKIATNVVYEKAASVDMRYSTNCGATTTWALGDYIYLVGTLGSDGLFYLDTTTWWSNALPATNDGKLYIRLGIALAAAGYTMSFFEDRPIFYHDGTKICEYMQADNKQDKLVSGTNIKTINNQSIVGSGNVDIDTLPSQSGQSGKYLTTNGSAASWATLNIPTTTDSVTSGSTAALTSGGAYTNLVTAVAAGSTANKINVTKAGSTSTITVNNVANATTASKLGSTTVGGVTQPIYLDSGTPTALSYTIAKSVPSDAVFTDHTYTNGAGINLTNGNTFSAKCDTTTVSTNGSSQLQALGVIDKKTSAAVYTWTGTKAQYNALSTYHNDWIYYITDDGTLTGDYYTKSQIDAMMVDNHTIMHDTAKVILKDTNTNANAATTPSINHNGGLVEFQDKNGVKSGYLYTAYKSNGNIEQVLESDRTISGTAKTAAIKVGIKSDGTAYTEAPTPAASTSTSDANIATVGWINDPTKSTGLVHITGAETITGAKTFSANNTFNGTDTFTGNTRFTGNPVFISDNNTDALTIKNDDDIYSVLPVETLSTNIALHDKNGEVIGGLEHYHQADGASISQMTARQHGGSNYGTIRVGIDISGNTWCNLPTDTYGTNFHGTSTRSMWADLAENYESDKEYPIGTLIRFGGEKDITIATINCNGVISDKPGYVLDSDLKNGQPVALVGKTPIRVLGKVNRFDRIVLDPEHPGLGKVQTTSDEKVIAIALKANSDVNEKLVMCVTKFNLD